MAFILAASYSSFSQNLQEDSLRHKLDKSLSHIYREVLLRPGRVTVDSIALNKHKKSFELHTNLSLSYLPMRENTVRQIYDSIRYHLPSAQKKYRISVFSDKQEISTLVPNFYRQSRKDKNRMILHKVKPPLVTNVSAPENSFDKGLTNNHIALWQSHGWYYEQKLGRWEWQRARIFQTVEDLYTQSYVLPFLVPMLENAGANVLLPRERDYNKQEVIIDNDGSKGGSTYSEMNGKETWQNSDSAGFANLREIWLNGENPFRMGTARQTKTVSRGEESIASWTPDIPEKGRYAVFVSYQTVKNSSDDARYSVYHAGGKTDFRVNQQMGGGTWIFLGNFDFEEGTSHRITLSNR
ncbi:MAG: xanthan lyase, partial [Petrimonas sp.]|nr:xanthan lyase [Petrimonas sp.]